MYTVHSSQLCMEVRKYVYTSTLNTTFWENKYVHVYVLPLGSRLSSGSPRTNHENFKGRETWQFS